MQVIWAARVGASRQPAVSTAGGEGSASGVATTGPPTAVGRAPQVSGWLEGGGSWLTTMVRPGGGTWKTSGRATGGPEGSSAGADAPSRSQRPQTPIGMAISPSSRCPPPRRRRGGIVP
jgi:hypothetical protein